MHLHIFLILPLSNVFLPPNHPITRQMPHTLLPHLEIRHGFPARLQLPCKGPPRHAPVLYVLAEHAPILVAAPNQHHTAGMQATVAR